MTKRFWEQWEYRVWLAATELTASAPATRGVWADWISTMMEHQTWYVKGDLDTLAKMGRCTRREVVAALREIARNEIADLEVEGVTANVTHFVTNLSCSCKAEIRVISRKRRQQLKEKETNKLRQRRHRAQMQRHAQVTPDLKSKSKNNKVTNVTLLETKSSGTRLDAFFEVSEKMMSWALAECSGVNVPEETARFRDYYAAAAGQKGLSYDWTATWRNWMRNARNKSVGGFDGKIRREEPNARNSSGNTTDILRRIGARSAD